MQLNSTSPLKGLSLDELNKKADFLRQLCLNLDPYSPLAENQRADLIELGLKDLDDPFRVTNELIMQMENVLEEIQTRENHLQ